MIDLVISRHSGLVDFLKEAGVCSPDVEVWPHVEDPATLEGRHVAGVLPLHMAARAASVTVVSMDLPPDLRGVELSAKTMKRLNPRIETFVVRKEP